MKKSKKTVWKGWITIMAVFMLSQAVCASPKKDNTADTNKGKSVLIVGLNDNVKSNYFYKGMIAEETGINADSISAIYNRILAENIAKAAAKKKKLAVSTLVPGADSNQFVNEIKVIGEEEDCQSDLSQVSDEEWKKTLDKAQAEYVLVLNQHYLKWQEEQLHTLFHIVSFSLFDENKQEIYHGNSYFTSMNLITPQEMEKTCRKSAAKIANNIIKHIE